MREEWRFTASARVRSNFVLPRLGAPSRHAFEPALCSAVNHLARCSALAGVAGDRAHVLRRALQVGGVPLSIRIVAAAVSLTAALAAGVSASLSRLPGLLRIPRTVRTGRTRHG